MTSGSKVQASHFCYILIPLLGSGFLAVRWKIHLCRVYPRTEKKAASINGWENIILFGKNPSKVMHWWARVRWVWGRIFKKFCPAYLYLSLETVFVTLKLTQSCYINMKKIFLKNWDLIINWLPLSYIHTMPETITLQFAKIWKQGDFSNQPVCLKRSFIWLCCFNNDTWYVTEVCRFPQNSRFP